MSSNNSLVILRNKGEFEIHENFCVDNPFKPTKENLVGKEETLIKAIKFAQSYCRENLVEYGYIISDDCLEEE